MDGNISLANVINITSRVFLGSIVVIPLSLSNYDMSHQEGLSLKYSKTAPPLAVFDDEKIFLKIEKSEEERVLKKIVTLRSTKNRKVKSSARLMALNISKSFSDLQKSRKKPKEIRFLAGLSLDKNSTNIKLIKHTAVKTTTSRETFISKLSPKLRTRVKEIENFDEILREDYSTESAFPAKARSVLKKAGINPDIPSDYEIANTYRANSAMPRRSYTQRMKAARKRDEGIKKDLATRFADSGYRRGAKPAEQPEKPIEKEIDEKTQQKGGVVASLNKERQVLLSGPIEITSGLALTNNQQISIYRQIAGTKYGSGQIMIKEGRYEIFVDNPSSGVVIAELLDNGVMIGRAELLMPEVMLNAKTKDDLKNIPIKIEPVVDKVIATNFSSYSYLKNQKLKNSKISINDAINVDTKIFNSTILVKSTKENHWGNISIGSSKQIFNNILSPDKTINALKDLLGITTPKEQMGIIQGQVIIKGKPIAGAQVEIMGIQQSILKPVYFNSFLPNTKLNHTTENGKYAFVDVPEGSYLVRAKYQGKYLSPQVAPVESGFVTQVQFVVKDSSLAEAFVFDIQTSEMMSAQINFLGSEKSVFAEGKKLIAFSGTEGVQFLQAQSQDTNKYYSTRLTVDKSEKEILIPLISRQWLNSLMSNLRITSIPDTGVVIGTALNLPYAIELDPRAYNRDSKILYFDNQGKLAIGATATPVGGGFIAVNVNPGIRSLFTRYAGTKNLKITTMAVDSSAINIFTSKF